VEVIGVEDGEGADIIGGGEWRYFLRLFYHRLRLGLRKVAFLGKDGVWQGDAQDDEQQARFIE
jgi:hypothetical protein